MSLHILALIKLNVFMITAVTIFLATEMVRVEYILYSVLLGIKFDCVG